MMDVLGIEKVLCELSQHASLDLISEKNKEYLIRSNKRLKAYLFNEKVDESILKNTEEPIVFINKIFSVEQNEKNTLEYLKKFVESVENNQLENYKNIFLYYKRSEYNKNLFCS